MFSIPAAFVLGVLGIIFDKRKWLAILTTVISGTLLAFYILMIVINILR